MRKWGWHRSAKYFRYKRASIDVEMAWHWWAKSGYPVCCRPLCPAETAVCWLTAGWLVDVRRTHIGGQLAPFGIQDECLSAASGRTHVPCGGRGGAGRVGTGRRWSITMSTVSPARYHRRCCCCSWASARRTDEPEWLHHCHCTVDCWRSVRMPHPRSAIARWCRNRQPRHAVLRRHCRHSTVDSVITVTCHRWSGAERWATAELRQFSASQRVLVTTGVYHEPFITLTLSERWNRLIIAVGENRANWWVVGNDQKTFRTLITVDGLRSLRLGVASGWVSERLACSQCV